VAAALRPNDILTNDGWKRRNPEWIALGETSDEWKRCKGIIEHAFTARWTTTEGNKVTIRRGDKTAGLTTTREVFWRLMALWEGTKEGGAFAMAVCKCLETLKPDAIRKGRSNRKQEMCWASPRALLWIFVEELGIEGELACDLANMFEGFRKWWIWEHMPLFTGGGKVKRNGLTSAAFDEARYGYTNPEYNGGETSETSDHVMLSIRLASASVKSASWKNEGRRFVLVIPLFKRENDKYRRTVLSYGGRILFECPPGTMGFIPDGHWKGTKSTRVGNMKHTVGVVVFENHAARVERPYNEERLQKRLGAWLASQHKNREPAGCMVNTIPQDIRWWAGGEREDDGVQRVGSARQICASWNPILGAIGYPPPTFKKVLQELGVDPMDARELQTSITAITRAGAKELWETRNQAQLRNESEQGITAAAKRDKIKAAEYRANHRQLTGKEKAAIREASSPGKVPREPLRDALGRVMSRYCSEKGCEMLTSSTGRYCTNCDATLPSRARTPWSPMTRVRTEQWKEERLYWKARLMAIFRSEGTLAIVINEVLGWLLKETQHNLTKNNLYFDVVSRQSNLGRAKVQRVEGTTVSVKKVQQTFKKTRTRQSTKKNNQQTGTKDNLKTITWKISTAKNGQKASTSGRKERNNGVVIGRTDEAAQRKIRERQDDEHEANGGQRVRRRLFLNEEELTDERNEMEVGERMSEMSGQERQMNGQVVGARVNEEGIDVTKDDGRASWGARKMDTKEKVRGKRNIDEFETSDDE